MPQINNAEELEARFGRWPSFHDAEIQALRLDSGQRSQSTPTLELGVHVFAVAPASQENSYSFGLHTLVTLEFADIEDLELWGFQHQNVLSDLVIRDLSHDIGKKASVQVELPTSFGLGGRFRCRQVAVVAVETFVPGPLSPYKL
jgi:hypothetical protein